MNVIFDNIHIKQTILSHLQQATQSIEIAMAWFTDTDLAAALHTQSGAMCAYVCCCTTIKSIEKAEMIGTH